MSPTETTAVHKVLLVDDDSAVLAMMLQALERKHFDVVAASSVTDFSAQVAPKVFSILDRDSME